MEKKYKNQVDIFNFLRVVALFCVLIIHSRIVISASLPVFSTPDAWSWVTYTPAWLAMGMFFLLSGYLLGKGFYNEKYRIDKMGIISFYATRLIRILPMYLFFILVFFIFINPGCFFINNWKIIIPLLTFNYIGAPGYIGIGALWFISTIVQLYLLAPLVYRFIFKKFGNYNVILLFFIIIAGGADRIIALTLGLDWYKTIYVPFWGNLDYFFAGMLMNSVTRNSLDNDWKKFLRPILLLLLLFVFFAMWKLGHNHIEFVRYYAPTLLIVLYLAIFYAFDSKNKIYSSPLSFRNIIKNPLRIIDCIGILSFGMYLYHSNFFSIMPNLILNKDIFPMPLSNGRILFYTWSFTFIILVVWTALLYLMIEKPSNKYRVTLDLSSFINKVKGICKNS